jgi:hypothetical protein
MNYGLDILDKLRLRKQKINKNYCHGLKDNK